jgi:hypothetical protein
MTVSGNLPMQLFAIIKNIDFVIIMNNVAGVHRSLNHPKEVFTELNDDLNTFKDRSDRLYTGVAYEICLSIHTLISVQAKKITNRSKN